uniref:MULE transposase domain-containing protein n=1 Tax=Lactuca sativa TaxID=4236 RepID=A0A9R1VEA6_LACSA|nr:hypothetical protein LSAT_V11C500234230 [Lactuca sativa]
MDRFQAYFVAIRCCSSKRELPNTMFVADSIDGNYQTLPIAFDMDVENNLDCSTWFLMRLKEVLGVGREILFITNMEYIIISCIGHVFLHSYHGYTCKNVFMYMRIIGISCRTLEPLLWMTSKSYTMSDFE